MIPRRKKICVLLEEMLECAQVRDKEGVLRINKSLNPLIKKEQKNYGGIIGLEYDTCRQSCVLPFTSFPGSYDKMIADAKKRLSKIKKKY